MNLHVVARRTASQGIVSRDARQHSSPRPPSLCTSPHRKGTHRSKPTLHNWTCHCDGMHALRDASRGCLQFRLHPHN